MGQAPGMKLPVRLAANLHSSIPVPSSPSSTLCSQTWSSSRGPRRLHGSQRQLGQLLPILYMARSHRRAVSRALPSLLPKDCLLAQGPQLMIPSSRPSSPPLFLIFFLSLSFLSLSFYFISFSYRANIQNMIQSSLPQMGRLRSKKGLRSHCEELSKEGGLLSSGAWPVSQSPRAGWKGEADRARGLAWCVASGTKPAPIKDIPKDRYGTA